MGSFSQDRQRVAMIEYLCHEATIMGTLYVGQIRKLHEEILLKQRGGKLIKVVLFYQDYAPSYYFRSKRNISGACEDDALVAAVHVF